jgi:DNA invertase Pin-like site-specific DNA recombinase
MTGQRIGNIRVGTLDQNPDRQLGNMPLDRVFTDHASGKAVARPQLGTLPRFVQEGDTVVVHSMDRLARNLDDFAPFESEKTPLRGAGVASIPSATRRSWLARPFEVDRCHAGPGKPNAAD